MATATQSQPNRKKKSSDETPLLFTPDQAALGKPVIPMPRKAVVAPKKAPRRESNDDSPPKKRKAKKGYATAESMSKAQREISVSEFFAKNRHLLGFDNKRKALLTTVKEAVDNSLDACEEAGILPDIFVKIEQTDADCGEHTSY